MELGLTGYSSPFTDLSFVNVLFITIALMVGTAGLPHVIVRFYTVRSVKAARWSTGWALLFIALLYTTAPTVGDLRQVLHARHPGQPAGGGGAGGPLGAELDAAPG